MTSKILCPYDGSDHATTGLHLAAEVAHATGGQLTICVVNIAHGGARGPTINHWTTEEAARLMADAEAIARKDGLTNVGTIELIAREAAPAIVTYADGNGITHIVMGTGDKKGLKRLVLGSVANAVVAQAHCTVTVAR